jgi:hypothetical protein
MSDITHEWLRTFAVSPVPTPECPSDEDWQSWREDGQDTAQETFASAWQLYANRRNALVNLAMRGVADDVVHVMISTLGDRDDANRVAEAEVQGWEAILRLRWEQLTGDIGELNRLIEEIVNPPQDFVTVASNPL